RSGSSVALRPDRARCVARLRLCGSDPAAACVRGNGRMRVAACTRAGLADGSLGGEPAVLLTIGGLIRYSSHNKYTFRQKIIKRAAKYDCGECLLNRAASISIHAKRATARSCRKGEYPIDNA